MLAGRLTTSCESLCKFCAETSFRSADRSDLCVPEVELDWPNDRISSNAESQPNLQPALLPLLRCGCHAKHIQIPSPIGNFCALTLEPLPKQKIFLQRLKHCIGESRLYSLQNWVEQSFKPLLDRTIREQRSMRSVTQSTAADDIML
jgi:hypothetical protein